MYNVAVWGDDIFTPGLETQLRAVVCGMVGQKPFVTFWFTDEGPFARLCLQVIRDMRRMCEQEICTILVEKTKTAAFDRVIAPREIPHEMPGSWPYKAFTYNKALKWTINRSHALLCNFNPCICRKQYREIRRAARDGVHVENVSEAAVEACIAQSTGRLAAAHQYIFNAVNHGRTYQALAEEFEVPVERIQAFDCKAVQRMREYLHVELQHRQ